MTKTTLLVDTSMVYAANKAKLGHLSREDGYPTGALFGFVRMVESAINETGASRVYLCLEAGGTKRKRMLLPTYKSGREHSTAAIQEANHGEDLSGWAALRGVHIAHAAGYEADDVIQALWAMERAEGREIAVLSKDHDFHALLDEGTYLIWSKKRFTMDDFKIKQGMYPTSYPLFLALAGDPTDSIPPLCTPKRAREIIETIETQGRLTVVIDRDDLERNLELVRMGLGDLEEIEEHLMVAEGKLDRELLWRWFERFEFKSLMKTADRLRELDGFSTEVEA